MNFVKFLAKFWIVLAIFVLIFTSDQVEGQRRPGLQSGDPRKYNNYYPVGYGRQNLRATYV